MLHKITDGDKFVVYVDDKMNDEINRDVLKMLSENQPFKPNRLVKPSKEMKDDVDLVAVKLKEYWKNN